MSSTFPHSYAVHARLANGVCPAHKNKSAFCLDHFHLETYVYATLVYECARTSPPRTLPLLFLRAQVTSNPQRLAIDPESKCPCSRLELHVANPFLLCSTRRVPPKVLWNLLSWLAMVLKAFSSTSKINQSLVWKRKCLTVQLIKEKKRTRNHMLDIFWVLHSVFLQLIFSRWAV